MNKTAFVSWCNLISLLTFSLELFRVVDMLVCLKANALSKSIMWRGDQQGLGIFSVLA